MLFQRKITQEFSLPKLFKYASVFDIFHGFLDSEYIIYSTKITVLI